MADTPTLKHDATVETFVREQGAACAATTITFLQCVRYQLVLAALFAFFCYDWKLFAAGAMFACSGFYVLVTAYKLLTVFLSLLFRPEIRIPAERIGVLKDEKLPPYTVLVPMYKEPEVATKIIQTLDNIDYPHDKLDVKLLLEEDDIATRKCVAGATLPDCVSVVVVPHAMPKTKPKACNHGLTTARGKYTVVYDAEDRPDPDQLKKAVIGFHDSSSEVACLQAKLNYYNPHQNLLTQWFTLEYTAWYELFLPGLHKLNVPIPLGGTSNHFRTDVLQEIGGWDPFNLTEDCDLGIRLHRRGWRTRVLDSVTWEEANSELGNWIRQRSRWVKGYIQTHFVHARTNLGLLGELGAKGFLSFLLTVGGFSLTLLLNPIFWAVVLVYGTLMAGSLVEITPAPWETVLRMRYYDRVSDIPGAPLTLWSQLSIVFWAAAIGLFVANFIFILINLLACLRRRLWRLMPHALLSPIYWVLISIAAWKGFLQLFSRPFYWEKTRHGLATEGASHE